VLLTMTALWGAPALAQDIPEEEEALDIPDSDDDPGTRSGFDVGADEFQVEDDDEDPDMVDYRAEALKRPPDPTHFHLDPAGKQPLGNDFPLHTVALNPEWVKVQLPVLVATSRAAFLSEHPHGLRLVAEWDIGGQTTVTEQVVEAEAVWPRGPTFAFLTVAVQDGRKTAPVQVKVKTAELPPPPPPPDAEPPATPPAEPPPPPAAPKVRFAVTSVFYRKG